MVWSLLAPFYGVSYRLSIVTIALSQTVFAQFAINIDCRLKPLALLYTSYEKYRCIVCTIFAHLFLQLIMPIRNASNNTL